MRYPVDNYKTKWNNTAGYGFGAVTSYGRHDGVDINDNNGGDSDLGQNIYAIAKGKVVYYHKNSHPNFGFGYHHVYRITGPWGVRWVHNAHVQDNYLTAPADVEEGQAIARVGKSGTQYAHIHFSIFKVDPATLPNGIDTIARNDQQLHEWFEDPIAFIEKWSKYVDPPVPSTPLPIPSGLTPEMIKDTYQGLTGKQPSEDEVAYRLKENKPLRELIDDICKGDSRFFDKWVQPHLPVVTTTAGTANVPTVWVTAEPSLLTVTIPPAKPSNKLIEWVLKLFGR